MQKRHRLHGRKGGPIWPVRPGDTGTARGASALAMGSAGGLRPFECLVSKHDGPRREGGRCDVGSITPAWPPGVRLRAHPVKPAMRPADPGLQHTGLSHLGSRKPPRRPGRCRFGIARCDVSPERRKNVGSWHQPDRFLPILSTHTMPLRMAAQLPGSISDAVAPCRVNILNWTA